MTSRSSLSFTSHFTSWFANTAPSPIPTTCSHGSNKHSTKFVVVRVMSRFSMVHHPHHHKLLRLRIASPPTRPTPSGNVRTSSSTALFLELSLSPSNHFSLALQQPPRSGIPWLPRMVDLAEAMLNSSLINSKPGPKRLDLSTSMFKA